MPHSLLKKKKKKGELKNTLKFQLFLTLLEIYSTAKIWTVGEMRHLFTWNDKQQEIKITLFLNGGHDTLMTECHPVWLCVLRITKLEGFRLGCWVVDSILDVKHECCLSLQEETVQNWEESIRSELPQAKKTEWRFLFFKWGKGNMSKHRFWFF